MKLRTVGFALTLLAVFVLLGSAIWDFRRTDVSAASGAGPEPSAVSAARQRIRVEVLNAAGISGLARQATDELRAAGFDVVAYGNAGTSLARDSTTILDRAGDEDAIAELMEVLDLHRVEVAIDTTLYVEATLVLGEDWVGR